MSSRIMLRNRAVWLSPDWYSSKVKAPTVARYRDGEEHDCTEAIPPDSQETIFRAGMVHFHPGDKLSYRVIDHLPPLDGWASTDFWQDRWNVDHKAVLAFAQLGFLDPAMETNSQICRFRCRDELGLKSSDLWRLHKNRLLRATKARNKNQREKEKEKGHATKRFAFKNRG